MAIPTTREEFKEYVLRKIGAPVIQINVSDEQIEDRIDEALSFWRDYHYAGSQLIYLKHELTEADIENGYIEVPPQLLGVVRIFDLNSSISAGSGMFNAKYQFALNNMHSMTGHNIQDYYMSMQNLQLMQEILVGKPIIRYNRNINRVYLDVTKASLRVGQFIVVEAYDIIDGTTYTDVWNDRFLQNYTSALIRENWGRQLTKFNNLQLVGGVQFNGEQILSEAVADRKELEETTINSLQPMVYNFCG